MTTAIIAIAKNGSALAARLHKAVPGSALYLPERFAAGTTATTFTTVKDILPDLFHRCDSLVLFLPAGAAVRLLAPLLKDKHQDPAVVIVDEASKFAVSLLSGHAGGANALATRVAAILGAQPVITSAAEALDTLAVDLLSRDFGWTIENPAALTAVSAAIVNGEPVGVFQDAGEHEWWPATKPLPPNLSIFDSLTNLQSAGCAARVIITDRLLNFEDQATNLIFRPRSLVLGLGLHHGIAAEVIESAFVATMQKFSLSPLSLQSVATVSTRREESGLQTLAEKYGIPVKFFRPEELRHIQGPSEPSTIVARYLGIAGVCEPAAILASGYGELLVPKQKLGPLTIAVARRKAF